MRERAPCGGGATGSACAFRRRHAGWPAAALALVAALAGAPARAEPVDLELVLAADGSGSIDDDELRLQREGYAAAAMHPQVLAAIRGGFRQAIALSYIEWGGPASQHTIVAPMRISDEASAAEFARRLIAAPRMAIGYNSISAAIDYSAALMRNDRFEGSRKIIDVSGDGPNIGGRPVEFARDEAVAEGITINALVIDRAGGGVRAQGGLALEVHYERSVIGGSRAFVAVVRERAAFAETILKKMIREIAEAVSDDPIRRRDPG